MTTTTVDDKSVEETLTPGAPLPTRLTEWQVQQLLAAINQARVFMSQGQEHLAAWDVRAHLTRIFGFTGWDQEVKACDLLYDEPTETQNKRPAHSVAYKATIRLSVKALAGNVVGVWEASATGGNVMPTAKRADGHDFAQKTAESQALKRCAINLGDQFGLSLYNGTNPHAPVVRAVPAQMATYPPTTGEPETTTTDQAAEEVLPVTGDDVAPPDVDVATGDTDDAPPILNTVDPDWWRAMVLAAFTPDPYPAGHPYHNIPKPVKRLHALWYVAQREGKVLEGVQVPGLDGTTMVPARGFFEDAGKAALAGQPFTDTAPVTGPVTGAAGHRPPEPDPALMAEGWMSELQWQSQVLDPVDLAAAVRRRLTAAKAPTVEELPVGALADLVVGLRSAVTRRLQGAGETTVADAYQELIASTALALGRWVPADVSVLGDVGAQDG